jgi:bifunctional ADP-heptose synthase (sugar kinase/adenylyltransferase)
LDTRTKIIAAEDAPKHLGGKPARWVSGHFDPLLAEHVRRLQEYSTPGRALVVEITNPPQPLLAQRARAELVAALRMVDYVVLQDGTPEPQALGDADITEHFIQHVKRRHRPEGAG